MNDNGAITGMDAREDGVYITYVPADGADPVTKKLGSGKTITVAMFAETNIATGRALCVLFEDGQIISHDYIYQPNIANKNKDLFDLGLLTIANTDYLGGAWSITANTEITYSDGLADTSKRQLSAGESISWATASGCCYVFSID